MAMLKPSVHRQNTFTMTIRTESECSQQSVRSRCKWACGLTQCLIDWWMGELLCFGAENVIPGPFGEKNGEYMFKGQKSDEYA